VTCASMLDRMLEADLGELAGESTSPVAAHLRECARCRAVARRIVRDTGALGAGLARRAPGASASRVRLLRRSVVTGLAAAALLVVVVRAWSPIGTSRNSSSARLASYEKAATAPSGVATDVAHPDVPTSLGQPRSARMGSAADMPPGDRRRARTRHRVTRLPRVLASSAEPVKAAPVAVAAVTPPVSIAPVRIDASAPKPLGSRVAAHPPAGVRAEILRTANPSVTVVWLHRYTASRNLGDAFAASSPRRRSNSVTQIP
jgi:hypothetical protein